VVRSPPPARRPKARPARWIARRARRRFILRGSRRSPAISSRRARRSRRATWRGWARSPSAARCACSERRWPADPAILYWNAATVAAIHATRGLRARGIAAYFTIDAGPHVKLLCAATGRRRRRGRDGRRAGVLRTITASPGPGARLVTRASAMRARPRRSGRRARGERFMKTTLPGNPVVAAPGEGVPGR